jgi:hypothetical protein
MDLTELVFFCYSCSIVSVIGFILGIISLIIFSHSTFKESFYKYLRVEITFITISLFFSSFRPIHSCYGTPLSRSYISNNYVKFFLHFLNSPIELTAMICHNVYSFYYYLSLFDVGNLHSASIKNKIHKFLKSNCSLVTICIFFINCLVYLHQVFEFDLVQMNIPGKYYLGKSEVTKCTWFIVNQKFAFIFRDFFNLNLIIVLNIIVYIKLNQYIEQKSKLFDDKQKLKNFMKNLKNKSNVILCGSINFILGRIPILIYFILDNLYTYDKIHMILKIGVLAVNLSYLLYFILFYFINNNFRMVFNSYMRILFLKNKNKNLELR